MSLLCFAQTMFGNLIVIRILRDFSDRALISPRFLCGVGIFFAVVSSGIAFIPGMTSSFGLLLVIGAAISLRFGLRWQEFARKQHLRSQIPRFLERWILNLRTGLGTTAARERALETCPADFRTLIRPVFQNFEAPKHLFLQEFVLREMRACGLEPHCALERLQNLRNSLRREEIFRRKSGQALKQAHLQATVLVLLQILLTIFTAAKSGWRTDLDLIGFASALALLGAFTLHLLARRIKWTI